MTSHRAAAIAAPDQLRHTIPLWFGERGRAWLDALPGVTESIANRWQLELGSTYADSTNALVLAVTRSDGRRAVLKIPFIYDQNRHEADALRHYQGRGAVKLQDFDPATGALLLERIEPGTPLGEHADRSAITAIGCELLQRVWSEAVTPHPFRPLRDLVEEWAVCIPTDFERRGRRFPETFVTEAVSLLRELAAGDGREVLINHDLHLGNILAGQREPWLLIDPKPLVGERAFDVGQLAIQCLGDERSIAHARDLLIRLSHELGLQRERVRGWGFVRAVKNVQSSLEAGEDPKPQIEVAGTFLAVS